MTEARKRQLIESPVDTESHKKGRIHGQIVGQDLTAQLEDSESNMEGESEETHENHTDDYIVYIKGTEINITQVRPQIIRNAINTYFENINRIEKAGQSLRIFCVNQLQKEKLLECTKIAGIEVDCSEPRHLSYGLPKEKKIKKVISGVPQETEEEEIIGASGAVRCWRIKKKINGILTNTTAMVLEYESEEDIPERISIDYLFYRIRDYIPSPIRCYKCQRFGHTQNKCRNISPVCAKCTGKHLSENCTISENLKCANCGDAHSAGYKGCIKYQEVRKTLKISTEEKISYRDALIRTHAEDTGKTAERLHQVNVYYNTNYRGKYQDKQNEFRYISETSQNRHDSTQKKNRNYEMNTETNRTQTINSAEIKTEDIRLITTRTIKEEDVQSFIKIILETLKSLPDFEKVEQTISTAAKTVMGINKGTDESINFQEVIETDKNATASYNKE